MLLKWLPNNQLKNDCSEMYTQYSQLVNKLYVMSEVFNMPEVSITAHFGRIDKQTQALTSEEIVLMKSRILQENKYLYECYLPATLLQSAGVASVSLTAQIDTKTANQSGQKVYQIFTSGIFSFYIEPSMQNGQVPLPDDLSVLNSKMSGLEEDMISLKALAIMLDSVAATAETLPPASNATANVAKNSDGTTTFSFGIPQGLQGVSIKSVTSNSVQVNDDKTITTVNVEKTDNTVNQLQIEARNGRDGSGVFGAQVENGNLILYTQNVEDANFGIREDGYLTVRLN